jgi:Flp pilus assembly protein TadD
VAPRLNQGALLLREHERDRARRLIDGVLRDNPDNPDALFRLGLLLHSEGQIGEALEVLRRVNELAPDHALAFSVRGAALMTQGREREAIEAYREALRTGPTTPADHANLGLLLARTGRTEEALAQYRRAVGLHPGYPLWRADLAWMLATQEDGKYRDPEPALALAEEACRLTDDRDPVCLQALAAARAASGLYGEATATARRAREAAAAAGQAELVKQLEEQARRYEQGKPFRARAPLRTQPYPPVPAPPVGE